MTYEFFILIKSKLMSRSNKVTKENMTKTTIIEQKPIKTTKKDIDDSTVMKILIFIIVILTACLGVSIVYIFKLKSKLAGGFISRDKPKCHMH